MTVKPDRVQEAIADMKAARISNKWYPNKNKNGSTGGQNVLTGHISTAGGKETRAYPCHRPINSFLHAEVLWSCFGWRCTEKAANWYFDWLIQDSPWAKTGIVPKGLEDKFMFSEGFVFTDLDKTPANLLHNFLIATRMPAEWPGFIDTWYSLVTKDGIDPAFAFLFLTCFQAVNSDGANYRTSFDEGSESMLAVTDKYDWPLDMARATESYVTNFVGGVTEGLSKTFFSPSAQTAPVNTLWGKLSEVKEYKGKYVNILASLYKDKFTVDRTASITGYFNKEAVDKKVFKPEALREIIKLEQKRLGFK